MNRFIRQWFILILIVLAATSFANFGFAADRIPGPPSQVEVFNPDPTPDPNPDPPPATPPGDDSLLVGMTPSKYNIPPGWTLVVSQDMEESCPDSQSCGGVSGAITTTRPHTGSKSIEGTYDNDQDNVRWALREGNLGSFDEVYTSWYEYVDSAAKFNDEYFMWVMIKPSPYQEVILDWYWAPGFNKPTASLYTIQQGVCSPGRKSMRGGSPGTGGTWQQFEVHFRPNTPGKSNGFMRVYRDGNLYTSYENGNFVCSENMADSLVQVGGTYTKLVWMEDYPACTQCSSAPGSGTDYCTGSKNWSGQSFSNPICNPTDPQLPSFKRFIDDVVVMKK
jgi:hypothetical protein